ncbi:MAG: hypothetical protein NTW81_02305 [Actinobacteria bacterium]|nr:hypothetical protein [Actinomycetota bacterium]
MTTVTGERVEAGVEVRRTGRGWHKDDITLMVGSIISSGVLTWLAFYQVRALHNYLSNCRGAKRR